MISKTAIIHPGVQLGKNTIVEDYVILGAGRKKDELTVIGDNAIIRSHTVIYAGNQIGKNFQTGNKANIRESNTIGDDVSVGTLAVIEHNVQIEDGVRIHSQAFIPEFSHLKKACWIGPNAVLTNAKYPLHPDAKKNLQGPTIGSQAKIGANATILPNIKIGDRALIGAGTIVTSDVAQEQVVINPVTMKELNG